MGKGQVIAREPVLKDSLVANLVQHFYLHFKKEKSILSQVTIEILGFPPHGLPRTRN